MRVWINGWKEIDKVKEELRQEDVQKTVRILTDFKGIWVATPWDYSSSRWIRFYADNSAELCYGYGQTIYAFIKSNFEVTDSHILKFTYLESPVFGHFKGFVTTKNNEQKELFFTLSNETKTFGNQITSLTSNYQWKLTLDRSAFPDELKLPYEIPLKFYGHRICE